MVDIYQFKSNGKHILINLKAYIYYNVYTTPILA